MDDEVLIPLCFFLAIFSIVAITVLSRMVTRIVCHWRDVSLKIRMVEAGYSPSEIVQVMNSGRDAASAPLSAKSVPPAKPEYAKY